MIDQTIRREHRRKGEGGSAVRIIVLESQRGGLAALEEALKALCPQGEVVGFSGAGRMIHWLRERGGAFDVAFLDMDLPGVSGPVLAQGLREMAPRGNLIFLADGPQYMAEAFRLRASGYLRRPVGQEELAEELENLRYPVAQAGPPKLRVQAFGNFEVFYGEKPLRFRRSRTRELLAYLVDRRGAACSMGELISILWEGRPDTASVRSQLRSLITDLRGTLQEVGQAELIRKERDRIALDPRRVDCDYYHFLAGDRSGANAFRGEYMTNYSWAETTLGALERMVP